MLTRRRFEWNRELFFILALVVIGSAMRWVWPGDMEWKADEQWMYWHARAAATTGVFPPVGMMSGGGVVNPGLALWIFALVARVAHDPIAMVRFVEGLNIAAIWAFFLCYCLHFDPRARQPWLWGIGFGSVSCLPVVLSRKLWAQCLLPPFGFLVFLGHLHRGRRWGALLWGFASALLCQIHMSGFFFSAVTRLCGSLMLPNTIASVGQAAWQAVTISPSRIGRSSSFALIRARLMRCTQYVHFSITP